MVNFPEITQIQTLDEKVELSLFLDPSIAYFEGHFPGLPILPGVAQLHWAVELGKQYLGLPDTGVTSVEVLKFSHILQPGDEVRLTFEKKSPQKFVFSYTSEKGSHASGRIVLSDV